jgi:Flp pilus assembly pilin Flp
LNESIRRFWRDESGPEMVEWAVVTFVLLSATVVLIISLRDTLIDMFLAAFEKLQEPPPPDFP